MTPDTLASIASLLYGRSWQTALAEAMGVQRRTVCYWASGQVAVPEKRVLAHLDAELQKRAAQIDAARRVTRSGSAGRSHDAGDRAGATGM